MNVFVSWSGTLGRQAAEALQGWLGAVMPEVSVWMAPDIKAGDVWPQLILDQLRKAAFGIICITPECFHSGWLQFEAGFLASRVPICPYLIGVSIADLMASPVGLYHAIESTQEGTARLLRRIAEAGHMPNSFELPLPRWEELSRALRSLDISGAATARRDIFFVGRYRDGDGRWKPERRTEGWVEHQGRYSRIHVPDGTGDIQWDGATARGEFRMVHFPVVCRMEATLTAFHKYSVILHDKHGTTVGEYEVTEVDS